MTLIYVVLRVATALALLFTVVGALGSGGFWIGSAFYAGRWGVALLCAGLLVIAWRRRESASLRIALGATALALATSIAVTTCSSASASSAIDDGSPVRVVTFNVLMVNESYDAAARILLNSNADIILLQEVTPRWKSELSMRLQKRYPHQRWNAKWGAWGTGILSRRQLNASKTIQDEDGRDFALCARLGPAARTRRPVVCSVHLMSPAAAFPAELSLGFKHRLEGVEQTRDKQTSALLQFLDDNRKKRNGEFAPVVIGGDFNTLEVEPVYHRWRHHYVDAFREHSPFTVGGTWPHGAPRGLLKLAAATARIDYIFVSSDVAVESARVLGNARSDHAAVQASLRMSP